MQKFKVVFAALVVLAGSLSYSQQAPIVGSASLVDSVIIQGQNFTPDAVVLWNGSSRPTTYLSTTLLIADLAVSDLAPGKLINVQVSGNQSVSNTVTITIGPVPLVFPIPSCPKGQVNVAYTCTFTANGGVPPYTWTSAGTLPPGLNLSPGGVLSGTPTSFGQYSFTVTVTDSAGQTQQLKIRSDLVAPDTPIQLLPSIQGAHFVLLK